MSDTEVDVVFSASISMLVPNLVHLAAFHPFAPRLGQRLEKLGELLTSRERIEAVCWSLMHEHAAPALRASNPEVVDWQVVPGEGDRRLTELPIDQANPPHRIITWYMQAAVDNDRDQGLAVFSALPDDPDLLDHIIRWCIHIAAEMVRAAGPGCG